MRLLLVDRDVEFQAICEKAVGHGTCPIELLIEETPDRGLRQMRQAEADIVLLDFETVRCDQPSQSIRQFVERADRTPIVLLLDPALAAEIDDFRGLGVADCIVKSRPLHLHLLPHLLRLIAAHANRQGQGLRLSREQREIAYVFSAVMGVIGDAIVITDHRGRLLRASSAAKTMIGGGGVDILGETIDRLLGSNEGPKIAPRLAALEPQAGLTIANLRALHAPGEAARFRCRIRAFAADAGESLCIVVIERAEPAPPGTALDAQAEVELDSIPQPLAERLVGMIGRIGAEDACLSPELWHLRLEGVEAARRSLGSRFADLEKVAFEVVEATLRAELTGEDAFGRDRHGDIIVHLPPKTGVNHLRRAAAAIMAAQRAVLTASGIDLAALDADCPLPQSTRQELARIAVNRCVLPLKPLGTLSEDQATNEVGEALTDLIKSVPAEAQDLLRTLAMDMRSDLAMVQARTGEPSSLQMIAPNVEARERIREVRRLGREVPELLHQLNLLMLSQAAAVTLEDMSGDGTLTVVDLDIEGLTHRRLADGLLEFALGLPDVFKQNLIISLGRLPPGFFLPRIQEISVRLAACSAFRALEIADLRAELPELENARIPLFIVPYKQVEGQLRTQANLLAKFIKRAHDQRARVLVRGLSRQLSWRLREETEVDLVCRA